MADEKKVRLVSEPEPVRTRTDEEEADDGENGDAAGPSALVRLDSKKGTSTITASSINLFKAITGAGVLSLSSGVAGFSDDPRTGVMYSMIFAVSLGILSTYTFALIGRLCMKSGARTYTGMFKRICGVRVSYVVQAFMFAKVGTALLLETIVIGDLVKDLLQLLGDNESLVTFAKALFPFSALETFMEEHIRMAGLAIVGLVVLVPLGFLKTFAALAPVAAIGALGIVYIAVFTGIRYFEGTYAEPNFDQVGTDWMKLFKLVSMFGTAYIAHYNAPKFAHQLIQPTPERFTLMSSISFSAAGVVMSCVMLFGYLTFGKTDQSMILNNYAVEDKMAVVARLGLVLSTVAVYPFLLFNFRDQFIKFTIMPSAPDASFWWKPARSTQLVVSTSITIVVVLVGMVIRDLGFMVALVGSVLASSVCYTFPAIAALYSFGSEIRKGTASGLMKFEYYLNHVVIVFGVTLAIVGTSLTIQAKLS